MNKLVVLFAALLCAGMLCACGESIPDVVPDDTTVVAPSAEYESGIAVTTADIDITESTIAVTEDTIVVDDIVPDNGNNYVVEPPLSELDLSIAVPDFLDEEQQLLYRRARSIYPAFSGYPMRIDEYPRKDTIQTPMESSPIKLPLGNILIYYYKAQGRYEKWEDFIDMGISIFTVEYFNTLSEAFRNVDGYTFYPDVAKGGRWGYMPELAPDTFCLMSMTDSEIIFDVIGHYYDTWDPDAADSSTLTTMNFPIKMILTDNGWRFSLFNSPA